MTPLHAIYTLWGLWALSWALAAVWSGRTVARIGIAAALPYAIPQFFGALLLIWAPARAGWSISDPLGWAMVALAAGGFGFCWWARLHLGRLWSGAVVRKDGHHIVDTGPYAIVRHPIYTGLIASGFAMAVARGAVSPLIGAGLLTLSWWIKARLEEQLLRSELGQAAYDAYAARTPMLSPLPRP
jgi:protein-S-isoprenylcysteine O-methyltransferase Ste14